jgi:hypothetical protein
MIENLTTDADLSRRIDARQSVAARRHERCKRCRMTIPEDRRVDSRFCSRLCHNNWQWEQREALLTEIRHARRSEVAPAFCACGNAIDNRAERPGPIAFKCKKCKMREKNKRFWQQRRKARQ